MKKNVLFGMMALAMGAMTACSVEEVVDQAETNYIGFDPFANKVSRAITHAQGLGHSNFSVFGRYDNGNSSYIEVFKNQKVEWSKPDDLDATEGSWTYTPLVPWVSGKNYVFAAIAPYNASYTTAYNYTNDKYTLGNITLDATFTDGKYTNQIDYMTADKVEQNSGTSTSAVSFTFNHIASKIDFNFQPKTTSQNETHWESDVKIDIKKIELSGLVTKKAYTNGQWGTASEINRTFSKSLSSNNSTTYDYSSSESEKVKLLKDQFSWLVVPQSSTDASSRKLSITFDVLIKDAEGEYTMKPKENATAEVAINTEWSANAHYTYTVYIGTDVLGQNPYITFDVKEVKGWVTTNNSHDLDVSPSTQQGN